MKRKPLLFSIFLMLFTALSCQEDIEPINPTSDPDDPTTGEQPTNFETREVQITFPEGSTVDLEGAELLSFGESFEVGSDGKTKAISTQANGSLVYLFDKDEEPLLMGYLTNAQSEISPKTTANVLLYIGSKLWMSTEDLTNEFFDKIDQVPAVKAWQEEFETLWKNDPLILSKEGYKDPLSSVLEDLFPPSSDLDIRSKVSDINVDEGDIRSGIQVFESDLGKFSVTNFYRRRAHAFAYKMSTKLEDGTVNTIISSIGNGSTASNEFPVPPTPANTSLTGTIGSIIETGGEDLTKTIVDNPFSLDLAENEAEATYKIRVVGAGNFSSNPFLTEAELAKQQRLTIETFILDFLYPAFSVIFSWKDDLSTNAIDVAAPATVQFIDNYAAVLNTVPGVYDQLNEGNYLKALETFLVVLYDGVTRDALSSFLEKPYEFMAKRYGIQGGKIPNELKNLDRLGKLAKIIKIMDTIIGLKDIKIVSDHARISNPMDEWTITARSAKVSLLPGEATIASRGNQEIEAEIKNLEEEGGDNFPFFKWSTSGKYGFIQDTKGNKGESFESSDTKVTYYSQTSSSQLEDENNFEYVYVEAYYKNELIGRDTAILNLKKSSFVLKPKGLVLSGKEGSVNSAKFFIEPVRENDTDFSGKKIVWTIEGKHGQLSNSGEYSTVITTYDTNSVTYECTDSETEKGIEKITARIYEKSEVDGEYFLFEELSENVEINNEGRIKIIEVAIQHYTVGPSYVGPWINCGSGTHFLIPPEEDAISYTAKVIDFGPETIPSLTGYTRTWSADVEPTIDGKYEFAKWFHSSGSGMAHAPPPCGQFEAGAAARWGTALVIIRLKD